MVKKRPETDVVMVPLKKAEIEIIRALIRVTPMAAKGLDQMSKIVNELNALDAKLVMALGIDDGRDVRREDPAPTQAPVQRKKRK